MKIAYLSNSRIPSRYANSKHVMYMCEALTQIGHDVTLFAERGEKEGNAFSFYDVKARFPVIKHSRPRIPLGTWFYLYKVHKTIVGQSGKPDCFYSREINNLWTVRNRGVSLVLEMHLPPVHRIELVLLKKLWNHPNFHALIAISQSLKNRILEMLPPGAAEEKMLVAPDAARPFSPSDNSEIDIKGYGLDSDRLKLGYVGHLYPGKGVEMIYQLAQKLPQYDFHVVGGMRREIELWKRKSQGLSHLYFHGFLTSDKLRVFYRNVDVFLAPYQNQVLVGRQKIDVAPWMSPLKIFEYMAAGKPIIASNLTVIREVLQHEVNSLLVPPTDMHAWIEAIRSLEKTSLRKQLAQQALVDFQSSYTWQKRAENITRFIS